MSADDRAALTVAAIIGGLWLWRQNQDIQARLSSIDNSAKPVGTLANTLNGYVPVIGDAVVSWIKS